MRERRFACSRSKRRALAAVRVAPLRETPGISAAACASPSASPSTGPASPGPRTCGRRSASTIASAPATSPAAIEPGPPSRRSIGRSSAYPAIAGGTNESAITAARRRSKAASSAAIRRRWPISSAAAVPACRAISKLLRSSGSSRSTSQPANQGSSERWAELETGSSSAGPWTVPSAAARAAVRPSPGFRGAPRGPARRRLACGGSGGRSAPRRSPPGPGSPRNAGNRATPPSCRPPACR